MEAYFWNKGKLNVLVSDALQCIMSYKQYILCINVYYALAKKYVYINTIYVFFRGW